MTRLAISNSTCWLFWRFFGPYPLKVIITESLSIFNNFLDQHVWQRHSHYFNQTKKEKKKEKNWFPFSRRKTFAIPNYMDMYTLGNFFPALSWFIIDSPPPPPPQLFCEVEFSIFSQKGEVQIFLIIREWLVK